MTKVVGTQAFPNIAVQDPRQRRQKLGVCVGLSKMKDRSSFKFINQINQHLTRQVHLSR